MEGALHREILVIAGLRSRTAGFRRLKPLAGILSTRTQGHLSDKEIEQE